MLTEREKHGISELLQRLPMKDLASLAQTVTSRLLVPETCEEAVSAIIMHTEKPADLLKRRKIKKDLLHKYLRAKKVASVADLSDKNLAVNAVLQLWGSSSARPASFLQTSNSCQPSGTLRNVEEDSLPEAPAPSRNTSYSSLVGLGGESGCSSSSALALGLGRILGSLPLNQISSRSSSLTCLKMSESSCSLVNMDDDDVDEGDENSESSAAKIEEGFGRRGDVEDDDDSAVDFHCLRRRLMTESPRQDYYDGDDDDDDEDDEDKSGGGDGENRPRFAAADEDVVPKKRATGRWAVPSTSTSSVGQDHLLSTSLGFSSASSHMTTAGQPVLVAHPAGLSSSWSPSCFLSTSAPPVSFMSQHHHRLHPTHQSTNPSPHTSCPPFMPHHPQFQGQQRDESTDSAARLQQEDEQEPQQQLKDREDAQEMADSFVRWFYDLINQLSHGGVASNGTRPPPYQSPFGAQHFCWDASARVKLHDEDAIDVHSNGVQVADLLKYIVSKYGVSFSPNPEGVSGHVEQSGGLAVIDARGSLFRFRGADHHQNGSSPPPQEGHVNVGFFHQQFGLLRDDGLGNNWKIKYTNVDLISGPSSPVQPQSPFSPALNFGRNTEVCTSSSSSSSSSSILQPSLLGFGSSRFNSDLSPKPPQGAPSSTPEGFTSSSSAMALS